MGFVDGKNDGGLVIIAGWVEDCTDGMFDGCVDGKNDGCLVGIIVGTWVKKSWLDW